MNLYGFGFNDTINGIDIDGQIWSLIVTVGFAIADTVAYSTHRIDGKEYALRMALNGAAAAADVLTAGQGGGLGVRAAAVAARAGIAIDAGRAAIRATSVAAIGINATRRLSLGIRTAGSVAQGTFAGLSVAGFVENSIQIAASGECDFEDGAWLAIDGFRTGWGLFRMFGTVPAKLPWERIPNPSRFPSNQGFSGISEPSTRGLVMYPSRSTPGSTLVPPGWVPRNGGHVSIVDKTGSITQRNYGFTVEMKSDGTSSIKYISALNGPGRNSVPEDVKASIEGSLKASGWFNIE